MVAASHKMQSPGGDKAPEPSMEEILASIRRIISDDPGSGVRPVLVETQPIAVEAKVEDAPPDEDVLDLAELAEAEEPAPEVPAREEVALRDVPREIANSQPLAQPPAQSPFSRPAREAMHTAAPAQADDDRLMSPGTDATVSTAFRSLATTILTNNARTLEDLVREMMRPMLKAWLDDNLPSLVERLVRTEIERVARSGRL